MKHSKLGGLMTPLEKIANVASSAAQSAREATTRQSGTISIPNADGTRSILGALSSSTVATHVGDTTPPGKPIGVSAASSSGMLVAYWSGVLEGGIPDDFAKVVFKAEGPTGDEQVLGELYAEGSVSTNRLEVGKEYSVWATAEDDACAVDGSAAHNVSDRSDPTTVTITAAADSAAIEKAQKAADEAKALAKTLVASVDVEYSSGMSPTVPPQTGWTTESPQWADGSYIWQRTKSVNGSGNVSYSEPTCIQGASGSPGKDGKGIKSVSEQYYLSTSPASPSGGSWSDSQPAWAENRYIWTRSKVVWDDSTVTYTDPVLAKALNSANETAAKTAWYFWADSEGAHVSSAKHDASTGANILLTGGGIQIRDGGTVVASFDNSAIELGKNTQKATVKMCGGLGSIGTLVSAAFGTALMVFSERVGIKGNKSAVVSCDQSMVAVLDNSVVVLAKTPVVMGAPGMSIGRTGEVATVSTADGVVTATYAPGAIPTYTVENTSENGSIAFAAGSAGSDAGFGLVKGDNGYRFLVSAPRIATSYRESSTKDFSRVLLTVARTKVYSSADYGDIWYEVLNGIGYMHVEALKGVNGEWKAGTLPSHLRPADSCYYPLAGRQSDMASELWIGASGDIYVYTHDTNSLWGVVPWIPKL